MKRNGVEEKKRRKENHAVLLFSIEWARTREYYLFSIKKKKRRHSRLLLNIHTFEHIYYGPHPIRVQLYIDRQERENKK